MEAILRMVKKIYCFDLDNTLCSQEDNYSNAKPFEDRIKKVNQLYDNGNKIIIFTARGTVTKIDWLDITKKQLKKWNVKYHQLIFGKPNADYYIDDKGIFSNNFFNNNI